MSVQRLVLERVVTLVGGDAPGGDALTEARNLIAESGIPAQMHVGTPADRFDDRMTCEWLLGSFAHVIDTKAWFAMNSLINLATVTLKETP